MLYEDAHKLMKAYKLFLIKPALAGQCHNVHMLKR